MRKIQNDAKQNDRFTSRKFILEGKQSMDWCGRDKSQENQLEAKSCICNEKMDGEQGINFRHIYNKKNL